jgi:hypothetical protein
MFTSNSRRDKEAKMVTENKAIQVVPPEASARVAAAQAIIAKVRALRDEVPDFTSAASHGDGRLLSAAASVPPGFIERTNVAIVNMPLLGREGVLDPAVSRDLMTFADAFAPLADELEALASYVRHSVASARHKAGSDALTTYALAQRLAKRPELAVELAPHVHDMRQALGRRRKARQPVPATPPPTSSP